jgi:predicted dehydrogenase
VLNGIVDVAFVNMKYDNIDVYCHLSWLDPNKCRETVVVGSKQMVVCDSINKQISIYNKNVDISAMEKNMSLEYVRHVLSYHYGDIVIPHIDVWEPLSEECKVFMDCIENNKTPISDGELGLNVVKVLTAATESLKRKGEWVTL